jgi:L-lactate dehydrogenase (cytochrome)
MKLSEIVDLVHIGTPNPPYGVRALARCYSIGDLAHLARKRLPKGSADYLDGGGEDEWTLRRNRKAFDEVELVPRQLRGVSPVDTETTILGTRVPLPIVLSPVGGARLFHPEGELAVARAARHARLPYGISTLATQSIEAVAEAAQGNPMWFQLYVWGDRSISRELVRRARDAGYGVLLLSADTTVRSKRGRELHRGIELPTPELTARTVLDSARHPAWSWHFLTSPAIGFPNLSASVPGSREQFKQMFDGTVDWDDLEWIRQEWDGPIAIKGVLRAQEAREAANRGVDAVIVSNHGGRQMDHVPATLEVLPGIAEAVGDRVEVLFDSGIRRGSDILTALSLGARAVLIGRAHLYGLAAAGEPGVRHAIGILDQELHTAMALCGVSNLGELSRDLLRLSGPPKLGEDPKASRDGHKTGAARPGPSPGRAAGTPDVRPATRARGAQTKHAG